ncbi:MAG: FtsX-like permease family protein [Lachnospiraceae bacterium]|nr:FtsX-like permease family protein [Lachnospiraceae bacterium]
MKKNNTVFALAVSKLRYHRSRTILTGIAILLTTTLLTAIGTSAIAVLDMNRQMAKAMSNNHAAFWLTSTEQLTTLSNHINVESLETVETFAKIIDNNTNGFLNCLETVKEGLYFYGLQPAEGHFPEKADEICAVPAFFTDMGAEPVIGGKVTLSFRVNSKGEIQTREFTISGLLPAREITSDINDSRFSWGAYVSKPLLEEYEAAGAYKPVYHTYLRFYGEEYLSYNEIMEEINSTAADIGLDKESISYNREYLLTMTDPGTEAMSIVVVISLIVIIFFALVIYSIYYVGVITDIQEIGKLKALGASKRQIGRLFFWQGSLVSAFAIPAGLLLGYLLPYSLFPLVWQALVSTAIESSVAGYAKEILRQVHMFSLPLLLAVAVSVLLTVWLSLLKPIRVAGKVSPVEAIRYQENTGSRKLRKGHHEVTVSALTMANLTRNKKRTTVTILTMGLSCVLFICISAVLSSTSAEDYARLDIPEGDFRISLDYSSDDTEYPENNLDSLVQQAYFNDAFLTELSAIEGVEQVKRARGKILSSSDTASPVYEDYDGEPCRETLSYFTREDLPELNKYLAQGNIDYDRMTANQEILCTHAYHFEEYGLSLGDVFSLTLYDGDREIPLTLTLTALSEPETDYSFLIMTEDTWNSLGLTCDPTTDVYLHVEDSRYDAVKETLTDIVAENPHFILYSMDTEMRIGRASISMVKYPLYLILVLIAVISFTNLINTMITSIVTRKKELGILQAIGLSGRQLAQMLSGESLFFTAGTLFISVTLGNLLGYVFYLWAKENGITAISSYHYPLWETLGLALLLLVGQALITLFINKKVENESLIDRIRNEE